MVRVVKKEPNQNDFIKKGGKKHAGRVIKITIETRLKPDFINVFFPSF